MPQTLNYCTLKKAGALWSCRDTRHRWRWQLDSVDMCQKLITPCLTPCARVITG